jgi:hypothetical protein
MKNFKNKILIKEGTNITDGNYTFGGFPRILNEVKYDIPAKASDIEGDRGAVGIDEFEELMNNRFSQPLMAGQTENGKRGVPPEIRAEALMHIKKLKQHPQGKVEGYGSDHPIYKEALDAHEFFNTHFPAFGVEDQIAQHYNLFQ